jgi:hypothetical protein
MKTHLLLFVFSFYTLQVYSQGCCSGGSGSPIAGGSSQGVLSDKQVEISSSYQHISSNKFKTKDHDTTRLFDVLKSDYIYTRFAYGLTNKLTMSVEAGYFIDRVQIGLNGADTIRSSGIGDLIIFPRYEVYNKKNERFKTEITLGLGYKIPLGKYNDSTLVYTNPFTNQEYYTISPPTVQPTNGSQDFIFYGFTCREYFQPKLKIFATALYIKKGWNPLSQKFGDYSSVGLFVNRMVYKKRIGLTLQLKGEYIAPMRYDKNIDVLALYNIDPNSTGSRKVFVIPQLSYNYKNLTLFGFSEIPVYQYMNGTQIASNFQFTAGFAYRFMAKKKETAPETI